MQRTEKKKKKRVVVFSGGSGGATILRGLKEHFDAITAIVTMFDSGGSTGRLRDEFGVLPPGDVRSCILSLAPEDKSEILRALLNYRFSSEGNLDGHNLGNLILTALRDIEGGEFEAIQALSKLLEINGRVLPVSLDYSHLYARLLNGQILEGESTIDVRGDVDVPIKKIYLEPKAKIFSETKKAILEADVIIFGPGDLYTSIIPSLLVGGVVHALRESRATVIYISNIMTKPSETKGFDATMHVREVLKYAKKEEFDVVICNESAFKKSTLEEYAKEGKAPVAVSEALSQYAKKVVVKDIVSHTDILRHDSDKLARIVKDIVV